MNVKEIKYTDARQPPCGVRDLSDVSNFAGVVKCALIAVGVAGIFFGSAYSLAIAGYAFLFFLAVVPLTVWSQHAIAEEIHDGVHYRLFSSREVNDLVSKLYSSLLGLSFTGFRAAHLRHHRHFGTPEDPDYLKYVYCPHSTWEWTRFVAWNFSGVGAVAAQILPKKQVTKVEKSLQHPIGTAVMQLSLWGLSWLFMPWWTYPLVWFGTLVTLSYGLTQLRTLMEHYNDTGEPGVGALYDLTGNVSPHFFAGQFGYNYHGTHHAYPSIPNYRLHQQSGQDQHRSGRGLQINSMNYFVRLQTLFWRESNSMADAKEVSDSSTVSEDVARGGNLAFYFSVLRKNPRKIFVGLWESMIEAFRWVWWPRFKVKAGYFKRISLLFQFVRAELNIPGGTTTLETIWLAYAVSQATSSAENWAQVGCFKGLSVTRISLMAHLLGKKLRAYDTFEGLPGSDSIYRAADDNTDYEFKAGSYCGAIEEVDANVTRYGYRDRVTFIKGDVNKTMPDPELGPISFAYLDVDLVSSYKSCFFGLAPKIQSGTLIAIHEACYIPIRELIEDKAYWASIDCAAPTVEYIADKYGIKTCRNLAFLRWA